MSVKRAEKHYANTYGPKVKTGDKDPEEKVLRKVTLPKRDFSEISAKEKLIEYYKIPKKTKLPPPKSLIAYLKHSSPVVTEMPTKCQEHPHKVHNHVNIINPPKWHFKPVLADEFCLYFEDCDLHMSHVTIYDPDMHCVFNLTVDQALEFYPEAMEEYQIFQDAKILYKTKHVNNKSINSYSTHEHKNVLIIDSGADTSGIGGMYGLLMNSLTEVSTSQIIQTLFNIKIQKLGVQSQQLTYQMTKLS